MLPRQGEARLDLLPLGKQRVPLDQWRIQLSEPPDGITASVVAAPMGGSAIEIKTDGQAEPGLRGNLLVRLSKEYTPAPSASDPSPRTRRTDYGFLPAIPFEVSERKMLRR
jgi:hypothetical protein